MDRVKSRASWWWAVAIGIIPIFYFFFDPVNSPWMPQCVFHRLTGLQCMGCGAQRMLHALFHGDLQAAMKANYFLFFSMPFILFLIVIELKRKSFPMIYKKIHSLGVIITITAMLVAWLLVRNIFEI